MNSLTVSSRKSFAILGIGLMFWMMFYQVTILRVNVLIVDEAYAQSEKTTDAKPDSQEDNDGESDSKYTPWYSDKAMAKESGVLNTIASATQRLKIGNMDQADVEVLLNTHQKLKAMGKTSVEELTQEQKEALGLDVVANYDPRLLDSIINLVTTENVDGGGHEFINVKRITQGHRTNKGKQSDEALPEEEEQEPRPSAHYLERGQAADISEIDYLRNTVYDLELEVKKQCAQKEKITRDCLVKRDITDEKAGLDFQNGDEHYNFKVVKKQTNLKPIKVGDQVDQGGAIPGGGGPTLAGKSPHEAALLSSGNGLLSYLFALGDLFGSDLPTKVDLTNSTSVADITKQVGQLWMEENISEGSNIKTGKNALLKTGQEVLERGTALPAFGFFGETLDATKETTPGMLINLGREVANNHLNLPTGSLIGGKSDEILASIGRGVFRSALGDLPPGTLDDIQSGNSVSLEVSIGRGVLAKFLEMRFADIPKDDSWQIFKKQNPAEANLIETQPKLFDNASGLDGETAQMITGGLSINAWLQKIGAKRLTIMNFYAERPDAALNIEERPDLTQFFDDNKENQDWKVTSAPTLNSDDLPTSLTPTDVDLIKKRAQILLDNFAFKSANKTALERAAGLSTPCGSLFDACGTGNAGEFAWTLANDKLQAWLLDKAYAKDFDFDGDETKTRVGRFLTADTTVFKNVGIDRLAKVIGKDNNTRRGVRHYLKTGEILTDADGAPLIDLFVLATKVGFRSAAEFNAVFRLNAPYTAFENVGRIHLYANISGDKDLISKAFSEPLSDIDAIKTAITNLTNSLDSLERAIPSGQKSLVTDAKTTIGTFSKYVEETYNPKEGQILTPEQVVDILRTISKSTKYQQTLETLYKVGHQAALNAVDGRQDDYRVFALALADLAHGVSAKELYDLKTVIFRSNTTYNAGKHFVDIIQGKITPNEGIRKIGAEEIAGVVELETEDIEKFYAEIDRIYKSGGSINDLNNLIDNFAANHTKELYDAGRSLGFHVNDSSLSVSDNRLATAKKTTGWLTHRLTEDLRFGGKQLDKILGTLNLTHNDQTGLFGVITQLVGDQVESTIKQAQSSLFMTKLLFGRPQYLSSEQLKNPLDSLANLFGSRSLGVAWHPDADQFMKINGGAEGILYYLTAKPISELKITLPDFPKINLDSLPADIDKAVNNYVRQNVFNSKSDFWNQPIVNEHLGKLGAGLGVDISKIKGAFDRNLTDEQRAALFMDEFKAQFTKRMTGVYVEDLFGLQHGVLGDYTPFINGFLNAKSAEDYKKMGLGMVDSHLSGNFGISISWAFNSKISPELKTKMGLGMLAQSLRLDPGATGLALNFYEALFINGGINLDTAKGKQDVAGLMVQLGSVAGIPSEYTLLASAALTGDIESTLVSFAGQSFLDNQLPGTGMIFKNFYEAYISPLPGIREQESLAAWNATYGNWLGGTGNLVVAGSADFGDIPPSGFDSYVKVNKPGTGETYWVKPEFKSSLEAHYKDEVATRLGEYQKQQQKQLQYALMDVGLSRALDMPVGSVLGLAKAMFEGNEDLKLQHFYPLVQQFAGSESGRIILGVDTADKLIQYFNDPTKFTDSDRQLIGGQVDAWLRSTTGADLPPGLGDLVLQAGSGKPINFGSFEKVGVAQLGRFIEGPLGLPAGSSVAMYQAFQNYQAAQAAYTRVASDVSALTSQKMHEIAAGGLTKETAQALQNVESIKLKAEFNANLATAQMVTLGINIVFGQTFSKLDQQLGLPPGTVSMLVSTIITAIMVPGIALTQLALMTVVPFLAPLLIGAILGGKGFLGFGGGTDTVKIRRKITLYSFFDDWQYFKRFPDHVYTPAQYKKIFDDHQLAHERDGKKDLDRFKPHPGDNTKIHYFIDPKKDENKDNDKIDGYLYNQIYDRGRWADEIIFVEPKQNPVPKEPKDRRLLIGDEIALTALIMEKPEELPFGVMKSEKPDDLKKITYAAANNKIPKLLDNLITLSLRSKDSTLQTGQIGTHKKEHVLGLAGLIGYVFGPPTENSNSLSYTVTNLNKQIKDEDLRASVRWDEEGKPPFLTEYIHYQF